MSLEHREDSIKAAQEQAADKQTEAEELALLRGCILEMAAKVYGEATE